MDCEACGRRPATSKAKIEGAILQVCPSCASLGQELVEKKVFYSPEGGVVHYSPASTTSYGASELELVQDFGKRVCHARQRSAMTVEQLGQSLSINADYIRQIESGKRHPDERTARKLENALRIKLFE